MAVSESASSRQPFQPVFVYKPPVVPASRWNIEAVRKIASLMVLHMTGNKFIWLKAFVCCSGSASGRHPNCFTFV
jgi:hypothetical protein